MNDEYRQTIETLRRELTLAQGRIADLKYHLDSMTRAYNAILEDVDALVKERDELKTRIGGAK